MWTVEITDQEGRMSTEQISTYDNDVILWIDLISDFQSVRLVKELDRGKLYRLYKKDVAGSTYVRIYEK